MSHNALDMSLDEWSQRDRQNRNNKRDNKSTRNRKRHYNRISSRSHFEGHNHQNYHQKYHNNFNNNRPRQKQNRNGYYNQNNDSYSNYNNEYNNEHNSRSSYSSYNDNTNHQNYHQRHGNNYTNNYDQPPSRKRQRISRSRNSNPNTQPINNDYYYNENTNDNYNPRSHKYQTNPNAQAINKETTTQDGESSLKCFEPGNCAYVTLVMLKDNYIPGALILGHSLRLTKTKTKYSLICMITNDVSQNARNALKLIYDYVINVDYLSYTSVVSLKTKKQEELYNDWICHAFTKWNSLQINELILKQYYPNNNQNNNQNNNVCKDIPNDNKKKDNTNCNDNDNDDTIGLTKNDNNVDTNGSKIKSSKPDNNENDNDNDNERKDNDNQNNKNNKPNNKTKSGDKPSNDDNKNNNKNNNPNNKTKSCDKPAKDDITNIENNNEDKDSNKCINDNNDNKYDNSKTKSFGKSTDMDKKFIPFDRILFLDSDTIVIHNIDNLFSEIKQCPAGTFSSPWSKNNAETGESKATGNGGMQDYYEEHQLTQNKIVPTNAICDALYNGGFVAVGTSVMLEPNYDDYQEYVKMLNNGIFSDLNTDTNDDNNNDNTNDNNKVNKLGFSNCYSGTEEQSIAFFYWYRNVDWRYINVKYGFIPWKFKWLVNDNIKYKNKSDNYNYNNRYNNRYNGYNNRNNRFNNEIDYLEYFESKDNIPMVLHFFGGKPWTQTPIKYTDLQAWWSLAYHLLNKSSIVNGNDKNDNENNRGILKPFFNDKFLNGLPGIGQTPTYRLKCFVCDKLRLPDTKHHVIDPNTGQIACQRLKK